MKKLLLFTAVLLLAEISTFGQEKKKYYVPKAGDWGVGITFNAVSFGHKLKMQPKPGEYLGDWVKEFATSPKQMFMLSQDPLAALKVRYHLSNKMALRAGLGFNGSLINYKEYVKDDYAAIFNPETENKVIDNARSNLNSVSLLLGLEWKKGIECVRFTYGIDLMYTIAGGRLNFEYGNKLTEMNRIPTSMPMTAAMKDGAVNDFVSNQGIVYGRPLEKYNSGYIHGIGISFDMGLEIFLAERTSVAAAMNFTPVMFCIQPQTYTTYEGFSSNTGKVEKYNGLVSPGSNVLLYGTENLGFRISINYYF